MVAANAKLSEDDAHKIMKDVAKTIRFDEQCNPEKKNKNEGKGITKPRGKGATSKKAFSTAQIMQMEQLVNQAFDRYLEAQRREKDKRKREKDKRKRERVSEGKLSTPMQEQGDSSKVDEGEKTNNAGSQESREEVASRKNYLFFWSVGDDVREDTDEEPCQPLVEKKMSFPEFSYSEIETRESANDEEGKVQASWHDYFRCFGPGETMDKAIGFILGDEETDTEDELPNEKGRKEVPNVKLVQSSRSDGGYADWSYDESSHEGAGDYENDDDDDDCDDDGTLMSREDHLQMISEDARRMRRRLRESLRERYERFSSFDSEWTRE